MERPGQDTVRIQVQKEVGPGPRMPLSGVSVGRAQWEAGEVSLVYWQQ